MPTLTMRVAIGTVLTLAGPGSGDAILHTRNARPMPLDVPTRVWALADPTTDADHADVTWTLPAGSYEVSILYPPGNPRTPQRARETITVQVEDSPDELQAELDAMLEQRAALDVRIDAARARLEQISPRPPAPPPHH